MYTTQYFYLILEFDKVRKLLPSSSEDLELFCPCKQDNFKLPCFKGVCISMAIMDKIHRNTITPSFISMILSHFKRNKISYSYLYLVTFL